MAKDLFELDHYLIRRKVLKIFGASFHAYAGNEVVAFTSQKAFKLKEDIRIFRDTAKTQPLLTVRARQIVDFAAAYDIVDARDNVKVGAARRRGFRSLLRDSWEVLDDKDAPIAQLAEDSMMMATLRRFLSNLIPQTFVLSAAVGGGKAVFKQHFNPFVYRLGVTIDANCRLDRRLVFGVATLIAAIEGRQG